LLGFQHMGGFEDLKKAAYDRCLKQTTLAALKVGT
jgi:hypothetical protein